MITIASQATSSLFERLISVLGFPELKGDAGIAPGNQTSPGDDHDDLDLTVDEEAVYLAMLMGPVPF